MEEVRQNWYALKVFYNKVFEMEDRLSGMGYETYLACEKVQLKGEEHIQAARKLSRLSQDNREDHRYIRQGPVIFERRPMVSSLLFVRASEGGIKEISEMLKGPADLNKPEGFVYRSSDWQDFSVIPDRQMTMFILITNSGESGLSFFSADDLSHFQKGDMVRVTEGPLKGAEGYVRRIKKHHRLLVSIEGVVAVATSYIPPQFLEKIAHK